MGPHSHERGSCSAENALRHCRRCHVFGGCVTIINGQPGLFGVDLRDINESFGLALPDVENRSLNGFILDELGYVPLTGETLDVDGARVEVLEATETQVLRARVTRRSSGDDREG